jgi:hypothetical protein
LQSDLESACRLCQWLCPIETPPPRGRELRSAQRLPRPIDTVDAPIESGVAAVDEQPRARRRRTSAAAFAQDVSLDHHWLAHRQQERRFNYRPPSVRLVKLRPAAGQTAERRLNGATGSCHRSRSRLATSAGSAAPVQGSPISFSTPIRRVFRRPCRPISQRRTGETGRVAPRSKPAAGTAEICLCWHRGGSLPGWSADGLLGNKFVDYVA